MKKIIAAIDGLKYSDSTVNCAINLAKKTGAAVQGVFLDDFTLRGYNLYELLKEDKSTVTKIRELDNKDKKLRAASVKKFSEACLKEGVKHSIHHDKGIAIQELLHESIYSDLLIIDKHETLTLYSEKAPTRFIRDLLADVQCPVLIVSGKFKPVRKVLFLFDAEPSSVHAMKMFSYIYPLAKSFKAEVLSVKNTNNSQLPPDNEMIREFIKFHFPHATFTIKRGIAEVEILRQLHKTEPGTLVITGAYRRNRVSRWFKESMADLLMKDLDLPLFIAHNK